MDNYISIVIQHVKMMLIPAHASYWGFWELQVGLATPSAFSQVFRRSTGTTPKALRQQQQW